MEKGNDRWLAEQLISIVEHDSSAREALMGLVRALGFKVAGFRSATEFLLSAASRRTACLIAGLQLPESSGFDLYLRLSSEGTPIATVLITAYSNELVRQRVLNAGVAGCLTKPVDADDLFASICTALGQNHRSEKQPMSQLAMKDGTQIHYKDWGAGQPVVFSHGWPLGADAWEAQMMFLADRGYRTIGHDRRGHGRSSQPWHGNEMDTYADDLAALIEHLDLQDAVLVGHSTGGGEVARYIGRHGTRRIAKVVLVGAVPPLMVKTDANPGGLPMEVFDGIRAASLADRSQLYKDLAAGPFFGFNRPGAKVSQGMIDSFWRQGMMAGHKNTFDCIKAFSETDFTEDLKAFDVPTLIIHGDDDQVVPIDASARAAVKLVKGAILNVYPGGAHGLADTSRDQLNADLLDFINT